MPARVFGIAVELHIDLQWGASVPNRLLVLLRRPRFLLVARQVAADQRPVHFPAGGSKRAGAHCHLWLIRFAQSIALGPTQRVLERRRAQRRDFLPQGGQFLAQFGAAPFFESGDYRFDTRIYVIRYYRLIRIDKLLELCAMREAAAEAREVFDDAQRGL